MGHMHNLSCFQFMLHSFIHTYIHSSNILKIYYVTSTVLDTRDAIMKNKIILALIELTLWQQS